MKGRLDHWLSLGFLIASYIVLLVFVAANIRRPGFAVVAVGFLLNLLVISVNSGMPVQAADAPIVIQGGTVFDSVAGKLLAERTILIEGTKIESLGAPQTPLSVPDGARLIDAKLLLCEFEIREDVRIARG